MTDHKLYSIIPYKDHLLKLDSPVRALAFYKNHTVDLITGKKSNVLLADWIEEFKKNKISDQFSHPRVIHFFYELGFLIENETQLQNDDDLLLIDCEFQSVSRIDLMKSKKIKLNSKSSPDFNKYKKAFDKGYEELLKGNCYQFNLTGAFDYAFDKDLTAEDFLFSLWRKEESRGRFASATFIPHFNKLYLSNSPECLFQIEDNILATMPIKGTFKRRPEDSLALLWKKLSGDSKSQGELYMITDLLRNDLSRIEKPLARIIKRKAPLLVPGLIHQYSRVEVELSEDVNLWAVMKKIFPGGSITGAPKLRAMRLIHELEKRKRGFYCGSTLILFKKMKCASLNIRSAEIDMNLRLLHYQAGGGITLKSSAQDEYNEMTYKHDSFIRTLTIENC